MPTIDLSAYEPVPDTDLDANQITNGFAAIQAAVNALDQNNFASGKIFDLAKLMQGGATSGQALVWNGTSWAPGTPGKTYRKTTSKAVTNTTTDTDLLNGEIQVAAGALGTTGLLRFRAFGDLVQNSGVNTDFPIFSLKLGATPTTVLKTAAAGLGGMGNSALRKAWAVEGLVLNLGATNSQWVQMTVRLFAVGTGSVQTGISWVTGEGTMHLIGNTSFSTMFGDGGNTAAIDTTAAMNVVLSVINPTATATCETKLTGAILEVV